MGLSRGDQELIAFLTLQTQGSCRHDFEALASFIRADVKAVYGKQQFEAIDNGTLAQGRLTFKPEYWAWSGGRNFHRFSKQFLVDGDHLLKFRAGKIHGPGRNGGI